MTTPEQMRQVIQDERDAIQRFGVLLAAAADNRRARSCPDNTVIDIHLPGDPDTLRLLPLVRAMADGHPVRIHTYPVTACTERKSTE